VDKNKKKLDWKPALEIFSRVSTSIVVPIILALIVGKALDKHYGTDPWIFLGCTGLGFLISSYGIVRVVSKYIKEIDSSSPKAMKNKERN
jgi:F0F1-type ATP synthase assembly protein I